MLNSIAALLWPIFAFTALFLFKKQIRQLLERLRKGKLLGQEIELGDSLTELHQSAELAAATADATANIPPLAGLTAPDDGQQTKGNSEVVPQTSDSDDTERSVSNILQTASKSPVTALVLAAGEIEREVARYLASTGDARSRYVAVPSIFREQPFVRLLPPLIGDSVQKFWEVRNRIIHPAAGATPTEAEVISAVDSAITILRALRAVQHKNVVVHPGAEVYSDATGTNLIAGVKAVILETESPDGVRTHRRAFPTTRTHFLKGEPVAWEWNGSQSWGESWYRDPDTGHIVYGWTSSAEFVGRNLRDI